MFTRSQRSHAPGMGAGPVASALDQGRRLSASVLVLVLVLGLGLSGCATWRAASPSIDDARREALGFLEQALRSEAAVAWSATPDPIVTRCADGDGVRFQYLVTAATDEGRSLAEPPGTYWSFVGLDVVRSQEDFGDHRVICSATARADEKPWGRTRIPARGSTSTSTRGAPQATFGTSNDRAHGARRAVRGRRARRCGWVCSDS